MEHPEHTSVSAGPVTHLWTRRGAGPNLVAMTPDRFFVALVPSRELKTVKSRIESGERLEDVLGAHFTSVCWQSVRRITADSRHPFLEVEYNAAGSGLKSVKLRLPDDSAREEALEAARLSLPGRVDVTERTGSRLAFISRPLSALIACLLLAAGTHWFFQSRFAKVPQQVIGTLKGEKPQKPQQRRRKKPLDLNNPEHVQKIVFHRPESSSTSYYHPGSKGLSRSLSRNPGVARLLMLGITVLSILGFVLGLMGYELSLSLFAGLAVACFCWLVARFLSPPRRVTITCQP